MDGIGGITIGNVFKIPEDSLPKRYREKKVAYIVTGVNHSIQNNDRTTTIEAQTLLMLPPKGVPLQKFIDIQVSIASILGEGEDLVLKRIKSFIDKKIQQAVQVIQEVINNDDEVPIVPPNQGNQGNQPRVPIRISPTAKGGSESAMLQATKAVFKGGKGAEGQCGYYTYNIARDYILALNGKPTKGLFEKAGGNAGSEAYRRRLQQLGYSMEYLGTDIPRGELEKFIINTSWNVGDIINYRSLVKPAPKVAGVFDNCFRLKPNSCFCYGHTQIYTNGVQENGGGFKWTSSVPKNYSSYVVYGFKGPWEAYVFRLK